MTTYTPEHDTPAHFDLSYDDRVPQRELTDFTVTRGEDKVSICALDDAKESDGDVIARGTVVANGKTLKVASAPLTEWCIEYGATPHLWIRTKKVWYKLTKPAKEYTRTHETARRRFELCSRIFILATSMRPDECTYRLFAQLLSGSYGSMKGYSEKEILMEKDFILAQIKNLGDPALSEMSFIKELRDKKASKKGSSAGSKKKETSTGNVSSSSSKDTHNAGPWTPSGKLDAEGTARLLKRAEKAVNQIYKHKLAWPFQNPVDPVKDNIPDYLTRINKPMDYGTIKQRLESGAYKDPLDIAKDVRQVTINCREYNGDTHDFSVWAMDLQRKFENILRSGEEAEIATMTKRNSNKKRKASDALPPTGKGLGKKSGPKASRKSSKSSSGDMSSTGSRSPSKDDESLSPRQLCARAESQSCENFQTAGSKYCSDECGMVVARKRIAELTKAGLSVEEYIRAGVTKALVHSRS